MRREHLLSVEEIMVKTATFSGGNHARLKSDGKRQIPSAARAPGGGGILGVIGTHSAGQLAPQFGSEQPQLASYQKLTSDH